MRASGFTLLELVVALAIAALLFVLVLPAGSRQRDHAEMATTARTVAAALRATRSRAIVAGEPELFEVDVQRAAYHAAGAPAAQALPRGVRVVLYTAQANQNGETAGAIQFYPDGSSTGGGVTLLRGDDRYDVLVSWLTGGVSVHEQPANAR